MCVQNRVPAWQTRLSAEKTLPNWQKDVHCFGFTFPKRISLKTEKRIKLFVWMSFNRIITNHSLIRWGGIFFSVASTVNSTNVSRWIWVLAHSYTILFLHWSHCLPVSCSLLTAQFLLCCPEQEWRMPYTRWELLCIWHLTKAKSWGRPLQSVLQKTWIKSITTTGTEASSNCSPFSNNMEYVWFCT